MTKAALPIPNLNTHLDELAAAGRWDQLAKTLASRVHQSRIHPVVVFSDGRERTLARIRGHYCAARSSWLAVDAERIDPSHLPIDRKIWNACWRLGVQTIVLVFRDQTLVASMRTLIARGTASPTHPQHMLLPWDAFRVVSSRRTRLDRLWSDVATPEPDSAQSTPQQASLPLPRR